MQQLQDYKVINVIATKKAEIMIDSPRYYLFILGLLGMQLGCPLLRKHRRWMKANYQTCLPMYERLEQAKMAVFGYENGKPLNLGSKTLREQMVALAEMPDDEGECCCGLVLGVTINDVIMCSRTKADFCHRTQCSQYHGRALHRSDAHGQQGR